jgi:hypothetical protein
MRCLGRVRQLLLLFQSRGFSGQLRHPVRPEDPERGVRARTGGYRRSNDFWTAYSIADLVDSEPEPECTRLRAQQQRIRDRYDQLSQQYQNSKSDNNIPLR